MAVTLEINTKVDTKDAVKSTEQLDKSIDQVDNSVNTVTDSFDKMTGGAITAFKNIVSGAKSGVAAMFTLKGAIAATGIGALVLAVGSLVSYFKNTQEGADKLNQAFEVIGATVDVLVDRLSTVGEAFTLLFTEPTKAVELFKQAVSGIGDEIMQEAGAALELERAFQALEKRRIDFIVTEKRLTAEINAARLASEDFNLSVEARSAANQRAIALERQLASERAEQAREALRIQAERNALGESLNEDIEKERNLEAQLFQIESDRDTRLKELIAKQRTLNDELAKGRDVRAIQPMETMDSITPSGELTPEGQIELSQQELLNQKILEENERFAEEDAQITKDKSDKKLELEKKEAAARQAISSTTNKILSASSLLAEKNVKAQKGIAAAQATFDTYAAIAGSLRAAQTSPGAAIPGYAIAQAVATGVFGFLQVRKILSTNVSGGGSVSSGGGGGATGGAVPTQTEEARVPSFDFFNQGVGGTQNAAFDRKAYVVSQDIKDQRQLDERLDDLAKIQ